MRCHSEFQPLAESKSCSRASVRVLLLTDPQLSSASPQQIKTLHTPEEDNGDPSRSN